jgi:hypothetical protein
MADPTQDAKPEAPPPDGCYAMVEQACAMAIQDAVAYLRNTEIVAYAAIGVALEAAGRDPASRDATQAVAMAQSTVAAAVKNLEDVSAAAAKTLKEFPRA